MLNYLSDVQMNMMTNVDQYDLFMLSANKLTKNLKMNTDENQGTTSHDSK